MIGSAIMVELAHQQSYLDGGLTTA